MPHSPRPPALYFRGGAAVVTLSGELDLLTAGDLTGVLSTAVSSTSSLTRRVVVDLSRVRFVDVVGVHALERAHASAFAEGVSVVLAGPSTTVRRVLDLVRGPNAAVLPVAGSVRDALRPGARTVELPYAGAVPASLS